MKTVLTIIFCLFTFIGIGQIKYPIQTIYKGDSVVILSVKQSIDINRAIETQKKIIREQSRKIITQNKKIDSLNFLTQGLTLKVDSVQYIADTTYKWAEELNLTIYEMAVGPSLIYTIPPYNYVYFINLDDYNMFSIDYGETIQLVKMTKKEYEELKKLQIQYNQVYTPKIDYFKGIQFREFEKELRLYEQKIWKNKNLLQDQVDPK